MPVKVESVETPKFFLDRRASIYIAPTFGTYTVGWMPLECQQLSTTPAVIALPTPDKIELAFIQIPTHLVMQAEIEKVG